MSPRTKNNIFIVIVGAIFLSCLAPANILPLLALTGATTIFLTGLAYLVIPKAP